LTYVPTAEDRLYPALVLDLFSRKVVGRAMSERMPQELTLEALRMRWAGAIRQGTLPHQELAARARGRRRLVSG
jgi:transposase InsO family protein